MAEETQEVALQEAEKREVDDTGAERTRDRPAFVPRADIYETDDAIFVVADMPGVDESSLDITLENNVLTINGYVAPKAPEGYSLVYSEYREGDYVRSFRLSDEIDRSGIEATLNDGVLSLTLPKVKEARTRKIAVKVG
jgi:HSP20 family protein